MSLADTVEEEKTADATDSSRRPNLTQVICASNFWASQDLKE